MCDGFLDRVIREWEFPPEWVEGDFEVIGPGDIAPRLSLICG